MTSTITAIAIPTPAKPLPGLFRVNAMTPNTIAAMASGMAIKNSSAINSATTAKTSEPMAAFLVPFVVIASGSSGRWPRGGWLLIWLLGRWTLRLVRIHVMPIVIMFILVY